MESLKLTRRPAAERCPYCHDAIEAPELPRVRCADCGTEHHQACVSELGRCSVAGCGAGLAGPPPRDRPPPGPAVAELRERIRQRARDALGRFTAPVQGLPRFADAWERARAASDPARRPWIDRLLLPRSALWQDARHFHLEAREAYAESGRVFRAATPEVRKELRAYIRSHPAIPLRKPRATALGALLSPEDPQLQFARVWERIRVARLERDRAAEASLRREARALLSALPRAERRSLRAHCRAHPLPWPRRFPTLRLCWLLAFLLAIFAMVVSAVSAISRPGTSAPEAILWALAGFLAYGVPLSVGWRELRRRRP